jgi:hypothetical protein
MRYVVFSLLLLTTAPAVAAECLTYGSAVILKGTLSRHTFPEQPNYESIAGGDQPAAYFFVLPPQPVCVASGGLAGDEPAESQIKRVQLVFSANTNGYTSLRPYLGKQVECRGKLFHAFSGHHHSSVLLEGALCHAV